MEDAPGRSAGLQAARDELLQRRRFPHAPGAAQDVQSARREIVKWAWVIGQTGLPGLTELYIRGLPVARITPPRVGGAEFAAVVVRGCRGEVLLRTLTSEESQRVKEGMNLITI